MRDRDELGRPRNARPRDAYGRPLPHGAPGVPTMPEDLVLAPEQTLREAQRLLDADRPFHAHEVLEAAWKNAPEAERELWRGLAQLAVGLTHARRGNLSGAVALVSRAADRLADCAAAAARTGEPVDVHGMHLPALVDQARAIAARIDAHPGEGPLDLRFSLRSGR